MTILHWKRAMSCDKGPWHQYGGQGSQIPVLWPGSALLAAHFNFWNFANRQTEKQTNTHKKKPLNFYSEVSFFTYLLHVPSSHLTINCAQWIRKQHDTHPAGKSLVICQHNYIPHGCGTSPQLSPFAAVLFSSEELKRSFVWCPFKPASFVTWK